MTDGAGVPTGTPLTEPPLIEMVSEDPVLRNTKMIAEAWDCDGLNQVGAFPHYGGRWSEWNGHFRDTVRQFIKVGRLRTPSFDAMRTRTRVRVCLSFTAIRGAAVRSGVCGKAESSFLEVNVEPAALRERCDDATLLGKVDEVTTWCTCTPLLR